MRFRPAFAAAAFAWAAAAALPAPAPASPKISHAFVVFMENQGFDDVIGHDDANGNPDTPMITALATKYGLASLYFGVTHPSLPNYLTLVAGDYLGVQDDNQSCFATGGRVKGCHGFAGPNIVDALEAKKLTWLEFEQSMPSAGYLGVDYPASAPLYYQKHNPLVYFKDIVTNANRLANIQPLPADGTLGPLTQLLSNPKTAPNFMFIVPDECHDMHGTSACSNNDQLLQEGDAYVGALFTAITSSPTWDENSALVIVWDENDYSSNLGCCLSPTIGGGHIASIVITKKNNQGMRSADLFNHYSLLLTLEEGFGLPKLRNTMNTKALTPLWSIWP
jgi:phospholipase C